MAFLNLGEEARAIRMAERLLELDPLSDDGLYASGYILSATKQHERAVEVGREMVALAPDDLGKIGVPDHAISLRTTFGDAKSIGPLADAPCPLGNNRLHGTAEGVWNLHVVGTEGAIPTQPGHVGRLGHSQRSRKGRSTTVTSTGLRRISTVTVSLSRRGGDTYASPMPCSSVGEKFPEVTIPPPEDVATA